MSTAAPQQTRSGASGSHDGQSPWVERTRVMLKPVAPPSILRLFGFAGATFIVAAHLAGWYGNAASPQYLSLFLGVAVGAVTVPASGTSPELGYWFLALAVITGCGVLAALAESLGLVATLLTLAVGSAFLAVRYLAGGFGWQHAGGWVLIASAIAATYTTAAMMLESSFGRVILPLGHSGPGERT